MKSIVSGCKGAGCLVLVKNNKQKTWNPFTLLKREIKALKKLDGVSIHKKAWVEEGAQIIGPIRVGRDVKILRNAIVKGPVTIGDRTIIGNGSFVRQSIIGKDCIVGYNTEIVRSHIGNGCTFHANFVGDSVIGDNSYMGYACCTSTVRLDDKEIEIKTIDGSIISREKKLGICLGRNCRIGSFVNFMPGICIGDSCHVAPNSIITQAVPPRSFVCTVKTRVVVKENCKLNGLSDRSNFNNSLLRDIKGYRGI